MKLHVNFWKKKNAYLISFLESDIESKKEIHRALRESYRDRYNEYGIYTVESNRDLLEQLETILNELGYETEIGPVWFTRYSGIDDVEYYEFIVKDDQTWQNNPK